MTHTTSTNDIVHAYARAGHAEGVVVVADHQTQGRGQHGRIWLDQPTHGLLCSLLLRPTWLPPHHTLHLVNAFVATLADTLASFVTAPVAIKWPNDVMLTTDGGMAKLAGVLCEGRVNQAGMQYICVGWGVNVHAAPTVYDVKQSATSVAAHASRPVTRTEVLLAQLEAFAICYQRLRHDIGLYQPMWQARQYVIGQNIRVHHNSTMVVGRALGMADDGGLLLETDDGVQTVHGGWIET